MKQDVEGVAGNKVLQAGQLSTGLSGVIDVELLLDNILRSARQLCRAEAGTIYLLQDGKLQFSTSQNDYLERSVGDQEELPFLGFNLNLDQNTLAGYAASQIKILTVNDTDNIDPSAPYQHFKIIDSTSNYFSRAIMSIPLTTTAGDLMGVLQVINPLDSRGHVTEFSAADEKALGFLAQNGAMSLEKAIMLRTSTLLSVQMLSTKDPMETIGHAQRVAQFATKIYEHWAEAHKVPSSERESIKNMLPIAAMLHDVGKCWIPKEVLTKPGRLDLNERELMEGHVLAGAKLFSKAHTPLDRLTKSLIVDHHERWDGRGYPGHLTSSGQGKEQPQRGKKGEEISIYGRVLAIADVYDALCNRKSYKEPFDDSLVTQIMEQERGHHFDPEVVDSFMALRPILAKIMKRFPELEGES